MTTCLLLYAISAPPHSPSPLAPPRLVDIVIARHREPIDVILLPHLAILLRQYGLDARRISVYDKGGDWNLTDPWAWFPLAAEQHFRIASRIGVRQRHLPPSLQPPIPILERIPLPNVGREAHTWLTHIARHQANGDFAPYTLVFQGDPESWPTWENEIAALAKNWGQVGFIYFMRWGLECNGSFGFTSPLVTKWLDRLTGQDCEARVAERQGRGNGYSAAHRGMFIASKERFMMPSPSVVQELIDQLAQPDGAPIHSEYAGILAESTASNPAFAHTVERVTSMLLNCYNDETQIIERDGVAMCLDKEEL